MDGGLPFLFGALGFVFVAVALSLALFALANRSLFVSCILCMLVAAAASVVFTIQGAILAAIAVACLGVGLVPVFVLGGMLVSSTSVKSRRSRTPWLTAVAVLAASGVVLMLVPDLAATPAAARPAPQGHDVLIVAILFVAGATAISLIGYGERGVLERSSGRAQ